MTGEDPFATQAAGVNWRQLRQCPLARLLFHKSKRPSGLASGESQLRRTCNQRGLEAKSTSKWSFQPQLRIKFSIQLWEDRGIRIPWQKRRMAPLFSTQSWNSG